MFLSAVYFAISKLAPLIVALSEHRGGAYALWDWNGDQYHNAAAISNFIAAIYNQTIDEEDDYESDDEGSLLIASDSLLLPLPLLLLRPLDLAQVLSRYSL